MGRAKDGSTFPLSLKLKPNPESGLMASVWVFCTISGLITLLPDGTIYGINHNFALMLFGYGKSDLVGKVCLHGARSWASWDPAREPSLTLQRLCGP